MANGGSWGVPTTSIAGSPFSLRGVYPEMALLILMLVWTWSESHGNRMPDPPPRSTGLLNSSRSVVSYPSVVELAPHHHIQHVWGSSIGAPPCQLALNKR